ncbi:MAG: hypothetical protein IKP66_05580 [Lachnospiraceae bacterium]|nr:hypothetical protein [Lachnospiraceae bacterium]
MRKIFYIVSIILASMLLLFACSSKINAVESANNIESTSVDSTINGKQKLTKEMAYNGIDNYCHQNFDWSIAKDNPDMMYVEMGEETDTEYEVILRSYTGSFTYFYVNKSDGKTRIVEYVPALDIKEESGIISIFDYIG